MRYHAQLWAHLNTLPWIFLELGPLSVYYLQTSPTLSQMNRQAAVLELCHHLGVLSHGNIQLSHLPGVMTASTFALATWERKNIVSQPESEPALHYSANPGTY